MLTIDITCPFAISLPITRDRNDKILFIIIIALKKIGGKCKNKPPSFRKKIGVRLL